MSVCDPGDEMMSDRISFTYSTSFAVADTPGSPNIKSSLCRQIISQRHIMIIWTLNIVSVECRHETNIQPGPWNNSFNTEDETACCCGKNIEEILFWDTFSVELKPLIIRNENQVSFQLKSEFILNDVERTRSFVEERCTLSFCYGSKL